jgi:autotransporter-associated beta strand protein
MASFNGGLTTFNNDGPLISVTGGLFSATSISMARTSNPGAPNALGIPPAITTASGFYVSAGTANVGTLVIANAQANSSATARIDGGVVNVTGALTIGDEGGNNRWNYLQVNGGALTSSDTTNGIVIGQAGGTGGTESIASELYLSGGTTTAQVIQFGTSADTVGGTAYLTIRGGDLYVASGGIVVSNSTGVLTTDIFLASGHFGATADFSTAVNMQLTGSTTSGITIRARDSSGVPHNMTFNGVISGSGALTKEGGGMLTLNGANSYTGDTVISNGTLQVGNTTAVGAGPLVANSGFLDLNGFNLMVTDFSGTAGVVTNSASASAGTLSINQPDATTFTGTINNGASPTALALTSGTLTLSGTGNYSGGTTVDGAATSGGAVLIVTSPAAIGDGSKLTVGDATLFPAPVVPSPPAVATAVPEPATVGVLLFGLLSIALCLRVRAGKCTKLK